MAKLSVDQALLRAKSLAKKGKIEEAQKLYQVVLQAFPKNKRAQQGLTTLSGPIPTVDVQGPPQEAINQLINFYNQGQLAVVVEQATALTEQYPEAFVVWNLLGASAAQTGQSNKAIFAFQRVIAIKPDYAEAYYNMGSVLQDQGKFDEAIASYNKALSLKPDYADAYNNMGNALKQQGKLDEAIEVYNKVLSLKPDYAEAYNNMGNALKAKGEFDAAIDSYKQALKIKPEFAKVKHLLASLIGETTKAAPREYVEDLFDQYAAKFEHSLIKNLQYQTPKIITEMIIKRHPSKALGSVLDLGCGTGLAGLELRQFCENLADIDLSKSMLRQARAKGVYGKLIHGDIAEHLAQADLDFDYFISTDVFIYVGELTDIFRLIKSRNRRRAKLVFSTEHREGEGFYLEKSGRYSHSKNYIEGLCIKYGYNLSHFEKTKLRKEKNEFLTGGLYLLDFDPAE